MIHYAKINESARLQRVQRLRHPHPLRWARPLRVHDADRGSGEVVLMGKSVAMPKSHIVSTRLNGDEYADFLHLAKRFGGPSKVLRLALHQLRWCADDVMVSGHRENDHG